MSRTHSAGLALASWSGQLLSAILALPVAAQSPSAAQAQIAGLVRDTRLAEISGIASSRRADDLYWVHNDSGNRGELFAIDASGRVRAHLRIDGVKKPVDPEDIASFELDGVPYLLLADTGDNGGVRKSAEIFVIEEPELNATSSELHASPAWRVRFHYADAPHDVEAVAVDAQAGEIVLLTKRTEPLEYWVLPLRPANDVELVAQQRGMLARPAPATPATAATILRPTALDIASGGSAAYVLTYREIWHYPRGPGESWTQAFSISPHVLPIAMVPQAEALGLARDGKSLLVTGEHWPAPIIRYVLPSPDLQNSTK